jgi:hypothetical protein
MKSTLHDVYLYRDDDPKLVEQYEECFQIDQHLRMDYYHLVYTETSNGLHFIHTEGASEPIPKLRREFHSRIENLINPTIDALCFMIASYRLDCLIEEINLPIPNPAISEEVLPNSVLELIQPTNGYMLYREQGVKFYQLATGCDDVAANYWLAGARSKKRVILDNVHKLEIEGMPSTYIDKLFPLNGGLPYLIKKPDQEAQTLLEFLQSK